MNPKKSLLLAALLLAGAGCASDAPEQPAKRPPAQTPEDAIYVIEGQPVTFEDGFATMTEAPESSYAAPLRFFGVPTQGDADGDGDTDAAVLVSMESQGSGTFFYVMLAVKEDWGYRGTEAYPVGDRIAPQTLEMRDGQVIVNYAERPPGAPMTDEPSVGVSKYFRVEAGELVPVETP